MRWVPVIDQILLASISGSFDRSITERDSGVELELLGGGGRGGGGGGAQAETDRKTETGWT